MNRKARAKQPRATVLLALRAADVTMSDVTDFVTGRRWSSSFRPLFVAFSFIKIFYRRSALFRPAGNLARQQTLQLMRSGPLAQAKSERLGLLIAGFWG